MFFEQEKLVRAALVSAVAMLTGCASQGPLHPPSLNLPGLAQNLSAQRAGDTVTLSWTTPSGTTDGVKVRGGMSANVCLEENPSATQEAPARKGTRRGQKKSGGLSPKDTVPCRAVGHLEVSAGPSQAAVKLGNGLNAGPVRAVAYRIELLNADGRSAGASDAVLVPAGAAPPAVSPLRVSARREGVVVEWKAEPTAAAMELTRTLLATAAGPLPPEAPATRKPTSAPRAPGAPKQTVRERVFRVDGPSDAGGTIDRTAVDSDAYSYVAQRVQTVTLGGQTLELRGAPSPAATFTYRDVFPPKPPTGLVSVPGGGFGEAPSIDLSWDAGPESDILGYNVYRREGNGDFVKLNAQPVLAPAYSDKTAQPGHAYTYRVTAVDVRNNESGPGVEVRESLRP